MSTTKTLEAIAEIYTTGKSKIEATKEEWKESSFDQKFVKSFIIITLVTLSPLVIILFLATAVMIVRFVPRWFYLVIFGAIIIRWCLKIKARFQVSDELEDETEEEVQA